MLNSVTVRLPARVPRKRRRYAREPAARLSPRGRLFRDLNLFFREQLSKRALRGGEVGKKTQRERRVVLERALLDLHEGGFELCRLRNFRVKHVERILAAWRERELMSSTLSSYVSHLRWFVVALGKPDLARFIDCYVAANPELVRRRTVADADRSPRAAQVDVPSLLSRALVEDERFAVQLALIAAFGLRARESWLFRPHLAVGDDGSVMIEFGTKGGRPRKLPRPITREQRAVVEWAKTFAPMKADSLIPPGWRLERWRRRFYRLCEKIGLTRKDLKITAHSIRHGVLLDFYEWLTGLAAPARGGALALENPQADRAARRVVAELAGHADYSISSAYLGPVRSQDTSQSALVAEGGPEGKCSCAESAVACVGGGHSQADLPRNEALEARQHALVTAQTVQDGPHQRERPL